MRELFAAIAAMFFAVAPAAAEVRTIPVCQNVTLTASTTTDCTVADISPGRYFSYQIYCTETAEDSMSVEVDFVGGQDQGSLAVLDALNDAYATEAAWSTAATITAPIVPVGTIRFTENNGDDDIVCSANILMGVDNSGANNAAFTGTTSLIGGAAIGETLGPELVPPTCAEYTYAAGWDCADSPLTFTRTASGSNLTFTPTAQTIAPGTEYAVQYTIGTPFAGTFSATVGGTAGATRTTTATTTYREYLPAATAGKLIFTAVAASTGTISGISVRAITSEITPVAGPVIVHKTFSNATANEVGLQVTGHTNGTVAGNKTALRVDMNVPTGSTSSGTEYIQEWYADGNQRTSLNSSGNLTTGVVTVGTVASTSTITTLALTGKSNSASSGNAVSVAGQTSYTNTSGAYNILAVTPTYNQASGTASNTDLLISRTETALGSGAQKFLSLQAGAAGTTEMYAISNKGVITESISAAITADAGSAQGGSPLTSSLNVITVVATAGDSVTLPTAAAGIRMTITNRDAADSADVFPASGDSINGGADNAAKALAAAATMMCYAVSDASWECVTLAR